MAEHAADEFVTRHPSLAILDRGEHCHWPPIDRDGDGLAGLHALQQGARVVGGG